MAGKVFFCPRLSMLRERKKRGAKDDAFVILYPIQKKNMA